MNVGRSRFDMRPALMLISPSIFRDTTMHLPIVSKNAKKNKPSHAWEGRLRLG